MIHDELFEQGLRQRQHMFGYEGAQGATDQTTMLDDKLQEFVTRICFGDIWQREGLDYAQRSRVTFAMLIALGKSHEIRTHAAGALANGVTPIELREIVLHSILYVGLPAAMEGMRALQDVLTDAGVDFDDLAVPRHQTDLHANQEAGEQR